MENIVIIGSGLSAFVTYLKFKKFNPILITSVNKKGLNINKKLRKNLQTDKLFSLNSSSYGDFKFILRNNTKLHDRLSLGGNSNIWGGFIDVSKISINLINELSDLGINFNKLDQKINGYSSNNKNIRQLRDNKDKILDTSNFIEKYIEGFIKNIEFKNKYIKLNYYNNKKLETINTTKLFVCISFPQLIDLLYRSNLLENCTKLKLSEFELKFKLSTKSIISADIKNNLIIKYDFIRIIKHFLGLQQSLDKFKIKIPFYIDQEFSNNKRLLDLDIDYKNKTIKQFSQSTFGNSIHYCNLYINEKKISDYLHLFSKNIYGVSMPFINQNRAGPISNDIINNIWDNF